MNSWRYAHALYDPRQLDAVDSDTMSLAGCALLGQQLGDMPELAGLRQLIAERLQQALQTEVVLSGDIGLLALLIDGLHVCDAERLEPATVVLFVRRLVGCEVGVGGPYRSYGNGIDVVDPLTNACILQCLSWLAAVPDNSLAFLHSTLPGLDAIEPCDWGLFAVLQQITAGQPLSSTAYQMLDVLPIVNATVCLAIMRSYEGRPYDSRTTVDSWALDVHVSCLRSLPRRNEPFADNTRQALRELAKVDTRHEISQLARYYGEALADTSLVHASSVRASMYMNLGVANMYAWAAYTIYDDFLDDEGQPSLLGTANYSYRAMIRHYQHAIPSDKPFQDFVEHCLMQVDEANAFETTFYRLPVAGNIITVKQLPDYKDCNLLADRALFHILGPMAVLSQTGIARIGDTIWSCTLQALRHYLIARQLNDDIHDWIKDLKAGQASYVVTALLRYLNVTPGVYSIMQLLPYAREQFWQHVLPLICNVALEHIAKARSGLRQGLQLTQHNDFLGLFDYVENSIIAAQKKHYQSQLVASMFTS